MRCGICSHAKREAIEAAASVVGASVLEVAQLFAASKSSIAKHIATHPRIVPVVSPSLPGPAEPPSVGALLVQDKPEAAKAPPLVPAKGTSARATAEDLVTRVDLLLKAAEGDKFASHRDRAALCNSAIAALKALATLTGENTTEANLSGSPQFKDFLGALERGLRLFPDAAASVRTELAKLEAKRAA